MWPDGYDRLVIDEIDSTNAEALRRADAAAGPLWICARRQVSGRGRRGRGWQMPEGNFAATLLLRPTDAPQDRALRSFAAALALYDAVAVSTGTQAGLALKWPNDVLLNGGKLAGILLEGRGDALAIGFGVNLIATPDPALLEQGAVRPVSLLAETGVRLLPEAFLDVLALAYAPWEQNLGRYGFAPLREAWLTRAARLGERVTARLAGGAVTGTFETVDERGALVLKTPKGREAIAAADVFFD